MHAPYAIGCNSAYQDVIDAEKWVRLASFFRRTRVFDSASAVCWVRFAYFFFALPFVPSLKADRHRAQLHAYNVKGDRQGKRCGRARAGRMRDEG